MSLQSSRLRLLALAGLLMLLVAAAYGQQGTPSSKEKKPNPPTKEQATSSPELIVIQLKHSDASQVREQLNTLLGEQGAKAVVVADQNALAISAPPAVLEKVKDYVKTIDVPPAVPAAAEGAGEAWRLQVVEMKGSQTDQDLPQVLQLFGGVRAALDRQREAVVLSGPDKSVQEAVKLLRQLEDLHATRPAEKPRTQNFRVRVVWLANYPGVKELPKGRNISVPPDLKEIEDELAKMGIDNLRLVSQSLASTNSGEFEVEGLPPLMPGGPGNPRILVKGTILQPVDDRLGVALSLDVGEPGEPQNKLCRLSTRITTTSGHLVVLGVTPAQESTSVFVVQIVAQ